MTAMFCRLFLSENNTFVCVWAQDVHASAARPRVNACLKKHPRRGSTDDFYGYYDSCYYHYYYIVVAALRGDALGAAPLRGEDITDLRVIVLLDDTRRRCRFFS